MDLVGTLRDLTIGDLILLVLLLGAFVLGFAQGVVRVLTFLLAWFAAFLVAVNLQGGFGGFLAQYWVTFSAAYNQMIAGVILYLVIFVAGVVIIFVFTKPMPLREGLSLVDEIVGGILGVAVAVLVLASFVGLMDTFYLNQAQAGTTQMPWLQAIEQGLDGSVIMTGLRHSLIVGLASLLGPLVPGDVRPLLN